MLTGLRFGRLHGRQGAAGPGREFENRYEHAGPAAGSRRTRRSGQQRPSAARSVRGQPRRSHHRQSGLRWSACIPTAGSSLHPAMA